MAKYCIEYGDNPIDYSVPAIELGPEIGRNLCRVERLYGGKYGGYRIDILTDNLNERDKVGFICTICDGIMKEACTSSSGEQLCSCCQNISSGKVTSNVTVRKMINTLKCSCPLIERGCGWLGTLEDCEDHLYTCGYVYASCKLMCGVVLRRNVLEKHVKETCPQRVVKCDHCKKDFKYCELNEHLNKCLKMKVPCDLCDTQIAREDMPQHLDHDCDMVQETCQLGCGVTQARKELKIHMKDTCLQREIQCQHCYISLISCDYSQHLKECPYMEVTCELCGEKKYRQEMTEHLKEYCPENMLVCPFLKYKCTTVMKRKDMANHLEEKKNKHLELKITAMEDSINKQNEEITKQNEEIIKQNEEITEQNDKNTEQSEEITKQNGKIIKQSEEITEQSEEIKKLSEEITKQNEKIIKQSEEITEQSEEIKKLSENNEKQNIEMFMEKENTSQQFGLLSSITETTKIIWKIKDVTNLTKKRLLESELYTVAGYTFRLQFLIESLTIVFPETASKYVKPFIAKFTIVLSTNQINSGMLEVKQRNLTRGCVRNITSISKQDIDEYSQPISPGSLMKDLTLEIYLSMQ